LMPALDLALRLRVVGRASHMPMPLPLSHLARSSLT
jgi:hypothetical protein